MSGPRQRQVSDDPPPFLGNWRRVYIAVLLYLAALIGLFVWFTGAFNR
jgi:hypothetical protein